MIKLLNGLGLYTKRQVDEVNRRIDKKHESLTEALSSVVKSKRAAERMEMQLFKLPFDFDNLISKYSAEKMNAFFYKMVDKLDQSTKGKEYLQRWGADLAKKVQVEEVQS